MTETLSDRDPVVPEGIDPVDGLTVGELAMIARALKADPVAALNSWQRWEALQHIGRAWERRSGNPTAKLDPWAALGITDLMRLLRLDDVDDPADDESLVDEGVEIPENPTD
jgi:hypothetical protein